MNRFLAALCIFVPATMLLAPAGALAVKFRFPVIDTERIQFDYVIYPDHDPENGDHSFDCLPWCGGMAEYPDCVASFPYCYDAHEGTDFMLIDGFAVMDAGSAAIVAAADGEVIETVDGNYDRCRADIITQEVTCDGHEMTGNHVKLRHDDGSETWYWHMKKDTVQVTVGDEVKCGDILGYIGSSGYSSAPHLHFEVRIPTGVDGETTWVDPFAGKNSQPESYWVLQRDPTTALPGCYCEGDDIPDFTEPTGDTATVEDVVVVEQIEDVYEDVPTQADVAQDAPYTDVVSDSVDRDTDVGADGIVSDISGDQTTVRDVYGDAIGADGSSTDVAASGDQGGNQDAGDNAGGGCSSTGRNPGSTTGLLLTLAGAILAIVLRRRRVNL